MSRLPKKFRQLLFAAHCFAQVYGFKGPWDAVGKVIKALIEKLEREESKRIVDALDAHILAEDYFAKNLPNGTDWKQLEESASDLLKHKTPFMTTNRFSIYLTEDQAEYDRLIAEGRENIIFSDRSSNDPNEDDATCMPGTSTSFHCVGTGNQTEDGHELLMRGRFCFSTKCQTCRPKIHDECVYKHIILSNGEERIFHCTSLAEKKLLCDQTERQRHLKQMATLSVLLKKGELNMTSYK